MDRLYYNIGDYIKDMNDKPDMDENEPIDDETYFDIGQATAVFLNGFNSKATEKTFNFTYVALRTFMEVMNNPANIPPDDNSDTD